MANGISHLPHISNITAAVNYYDPMHQSIYEVYFTLPNQLKGEFAEVEEILTEQVVSVSGLDALQKTPGVGQQKFMGVDVSFANPVLDNTYAEPSFVLNLNLRSRNDAFVFKVFKAWSKLNYDLADGTRTLKRDYIGDNLRIAEANRDGTIWRSFIFHDIILTEVSGLDSLDYSNNEARTLTVKFRSDYWEEEIG